MNSKRTISTTLILKKRYKGAHSWVLQILEYYSRIYCNFKESWSMMKFYGRKKSVLHVLNGNKKLVMCLVGLLAQYD